MRKLWQQLKPCRHQLIATGLFLVLIFGWGVANLVAFIPEAAEDLTGMKPDAEGIAAAEALYNEEFAGKAGFVELHGALQRTMGKREVGDFDVVKAADGKLLPGYAGSHVLVPPEALTEADLALLSDFGARCDESGTPFLYVQLPGWVIEGYTRLPAGVEEYQNANADARLADLSGIGIDTLDLRAAARADGLDPAGEFFVTDHHWTVETAFWAHGALLRALEAEHGLAFPNLEAMTDIANYNVEVYENCFLGSAGRRTGRAYGGIDDFTLITPAFDTRLSYHNPSRGDAPKTGSFDEVMVNRDVLGDDPFYVSLRYDTYLHGFTPEAALRNEAGQNRVLLVMDSYGQALAPFLALSCAEVDMLDFRYYEDGSLWEYMADNGPYDAVVCLGALDPARLV